MASEVTIDWCEANYAVTPFVAEFWNTLTSLLCMIPPLVWFVQRFPEGVGVIPWVYPLISFIMFGSVMFHGTLTWVGQLLDEVPILAFISFSFSTLFDSYSIRGASSKDASVMERSWWGPGPRALALIGVLQVSAITLLYTTRAKAYGLFLGCAIAQALAHWPLMLLEMGGRLREVRGPMLRMLAVHVALGYGGYALWCLENTFCEQLRFLQLHAWWHPLATFSLKPFIDLLIYHRLSVCGAKPRYEPRCAGWGPSIVCGPRD
mmetsp:Transcript_157935/g.506551  ORF Transcript_157935/g.506551 Transcript_157935/m.506551 type:complete len:263 (-) Transcript_157935:30-818(-)